MPKSRLALALVGALALAGCTSSPPPGDQPVGPTSGGGTGSGNTTAGNATGNATAPPAAPRAPETVHEGAYQWTIQGPAEATFTVPEGFASLLLNLTQSGPGVGTLTVELVDPAAASAGQASVTAAPDGTGNASVEVAAQAGDWVLRFGGAGVGSLAVQVVAS